MLSAEFSEIIGKLFANANAKRHEFVTLEHLLLALLDDAIAVDVLQAVGADIVALKADLSEHIETTTPLLQIHGDLKDTQPTQGFHRVMQRAIIHVQSSSKKSRGVTGANILVAIFSEKDSIATYFLLQQDISRIDIVNYLSHNIYKPTDGDAEGMGLPDDFIKIHKESLEDDEFENEEDEDDEDDEDDEEKEPRKKHSKSPLTLYTTNLNIKAKEHGIDPLIGRKQELQRVIQILCRRQKNNPLLVGESGVGKTAIAEGLARDIVYGKVPDIVAGIEIYSLNMGALLAGTKYRGDFEKRFKGILDALKEKPDAVLFIDEIHTVIGTGAASGSNLDASNLLKPLLISNNLRCMGSTTYQEYRGIFDKDRALSRRFQKIDIKEPDVDDAYQILKGLKPYYEKHYNLRYTDQALKKAAQLSERYINDRFLPDKAIDVIDEAGAAQKMLPKSKKRKTIGTNEIEQVVALIARIPPRRVATSDIKALRDIDHKLKMVIFGQDQAVQTITSAVKLSRAGLKTDKKPIGSFLFAGPTGVGKTEMCNQLSIIMGIELLRYDMSEYMESHTVSRLIGAPPGYVGYDQGGLLTEAVTKHPYSIVLLDEIEKAHPDVFHLLLQIMDHGTLTDNNGRKADFRNVMLIMTSNVGAELIAREPMGFSPQNNFSDIMIAIKKLFFPEFINRLDAIVQFGPLSMNVILTVVDKFIIELQTQLDEKNVQLHLSDEARLWLAKNGYDKKMGARPMQRLIQKEIKQKLAEYILFGELTKGGELYINVKNDKLELEVKTIITA